MKLYVMRHGPAEDQAESGRDFNRALTATGRERVRAVAKALEAKDESPHHIATSPLVRAVQTAEIVAVATKLSERGGTVETRRELASGSDADIYVAKLLEGHDKKKRVMIVGHEPDLSALVTKLLGDPMPVPMDKAMVVGLTLRAGHPAKLRFILEPKRQTWEFCEQAE